MSGLASSFEMLLTARFLQGVAASATRVLVVAIVRDRYQGSQMARLMSLVFIVFMIVPVLAPAFGQAVLEVASWRFIFIGLGVYCTIVLAWALIRLPETHLPEKRRPLSIRHISDAVATRSEVPRVGNAWTDKWRAQWSRDHNNTRQTKNDN